MTWPNFYFGMDSGSGGEFPCAGDGDNSYIGKVGAGITPHLGVGWNAESARLAGPTRTFAYRDVEGPGTIPAGQTAKDWGEQQASAFCTEVLYDAASKFVGGRTFFGDIEIGNLGWGHGTQQQGQDIVYGFLLEMVALSQISGLYANLTDWDNLLGTNWTPSIPFVWWLADGYPGITTCAVAGAEFNSLMTGSAGATRARGNMKVMLWQYNLTPSSSRDLNVTPYNGYLSGAWHPTPI